ncbi:MAG: response regulator [Rhodoferax sp.]|nr:response regulator [Rhodoferax sp.]
MNSPAPSSTEIRTSNNLGKHQEQAQTAKNLPRVLLVEDNEVHQRLMLFMLEKLGVQVVLAQNGQQGFEAVLGGEPAGLILMDLHMPRFDGYGATEKIREVERKQGQTRRTIIAVTAYTHPEELQRCLAVGMDAVLLKPVSLEKLKAVLAPWLSKGSGDDTGRPGPP